MPRRSGKFFRHPWRGFAAFALLALVPKCVLCVAGYFGFGALLGLAGPELCGGSTGSAFPWTTVLAVSALIGAAGWFLVCRLKRHGSQA